MEILPFKKVPQCIAITMDGNRRWERAKGGSPTTGNFEGHLAGYKKLKEVVGWVRGFGVKHLIVFALSAENLERSKEEVDALMDLCRVVAIPECSGALAEERIRARIIGDKSRFPEDIRMLIYKLERRLLNDSALWGDDAFELILALSYGGRQEIEIAAGMYAEQEIQKADLGYLGEKRVFSQFLSTHGTPDPD